MKADGQSQRQKQKILALLHRGPGFLLSFCILHSTFCLAASAADSAERVFAWNEANARMAAAVTTNDFLRAAQAYQQLVAQGVRNGPVFYNLGTALLQAGHTDDALDALARAERYTGYQRDITRNLKIALARKAGRDTTEWPWYRIVCFWHFYLSAPTRLTIAVGAWTVFWLALILRQLGWRRGTAAVITLALATLVIFGSSAATTWHQEATAKRYVIIVPPPNGGT